MNQDNPRRRRSLAPATGAIVGGPLFSILVPVYNSPNVVLDATISSVANQTYESWELILVDDASTEPHVRLLLERWSASDHRIRVFFRSENGNISAATNQAAEAAGGEYLILLDHDDLLDPNALAHLSLYLDEHPDADLVYSDEDKVEMDGGHHSPLFKPGWSPELLLSYCYTSHLTAVRRSLYHEVGGMRVGFEGSQDHDFWLRPRNEPGGLATFLNSFITGESLPARRPRAVMPNPTVSRREGEPSRRRSAVGGWPVRSSSQTGPTGPDVRSSTPSCPTMGPRSRS